jgi:hypothetical protein
LEAMSKQQTLLREELRSSQSATDIARGRLEVMETEKKSSNETATENTKRLSGEILALNKELTNAKSEYQVNLAKLNAELETEAKSE